MDGAKCLLGAERVADDKEASGLFQLLFDVFLCLTVSDSEEIHLEDSGTLGNFIFDVMTFGAVFLFSQGLQPVGPDM